MTSPQSEADRIAANRAALKAGPQKVNLLKQTNGHPESTIQASCVRWFRIVPKYKHHVLLSIPNGTHLAGNSAKRAIKMRVLKAEGLMAGASDLLLLANGRAYFLECKTAKGRQNPNQKTFQASVEKAGFEYYLFRSLDEFRGIVNELLK